MLFSEKLEIFANEVKYTDFKINHQSVRFVYKKRNL